MICSSCAQEVPDDPSADNRWRGCDPCGWRMHHGCWSEHLALGTIPCPQGPVETFEVRHMVPADGVTPAGRPRRRFVIETREYRELLDGHGDLWGMRGEFSTSA